MFLPVSDEVTTGAEHDDAHHQARTEQARQSLQEKEIGRCIAKTSIDPGFIFTILNFDALTDLMLILEMMID